MLKSPAWLLPLSAAAMFWRQLFAGRVLVWGTALLQFYPWETLAVRLARAGSAPLWNPYNGNGAPLAANYQSAVFYPPNWLYLFVPVEYGMSWLAAMHVAWAGLGMYAFLRRLGLSRFAALIGALAFELSGYLIARLTFLSMTYAVAWLPWLFWAAARLATRRRAADSVTLALIVGLQLLAGHAQIAAYSLGAMGCYGLWHVTRLWRARERQAAMRTMALAALGVVLGAAVAAVQLMPTAELLLESPRASSVDRELGLYYSFWPWRLLTAFVPNLFGTPATGTYWGYGYFHEDAIYVGLLPLLLAIATIMHRVRRPVRPGAVMVDGGAAGRDQATECGRQYPGLTAVPGVGFFALLGCAGLFLALGKLNPIYVWLFDHVPGWAAFQSPARLSILYVLAVCVLAAHGAAQWEASSAGLEGFRGRRYWARLLLAGSAAAAAVLIAAQGRFDGRSATFASGLAQMFVMLAAAAALALVQPEEDVPRARLAWRAAVVAVVWLDLLVAGYGLNLAVSPDVYHGMTVTSAAVGEGRAFIPYEVEHSLLVDRLPPAALGLEDSAYWRSFREAGVPNTNLIDGWASANNFDPLRPARYDALGRAAGLDPALNLRVARLMAAGTLIWPAAPAAPAALQAAGAGEVAGSGGSMPLNGVYTGTMLFVRVPDALPRASIVPAARVVPEPSAQLATVLDAGFDAHREAVLERAPSVVLSAQAGAGGTAEIVLDRADTVTIRAQLPAPGLLVLLDTYYPGWVATVDDRPAELLRANYAFRAVALPAGVSLVQFTYNPASFMWGGLVSLLAVSGLVGWGIARARGVLIFHARCLLLTS